MFLIDFFLFVLPILVSSEASVWLSFLWVSVLSDRIESKGGRSCKRRAEHLMHREPWFLRSLHPLCPTNRAR